MADTTPSQDPLRLAEALERMRPEFCGNQATLLEAAALIREQHAALAAPQPNAAADEWMPIETAPRDGTWIPAPTRAFLERTLSAMEGVIDVADRQTDEFEALRSVVIDLTTLLFSTQATEKTAQVMAYPPLPQADSWVHFVPQFGEVKMRTFAEATYVLRTAPPALNASKEG